VETFFGFFKIMVNKLLCPSFFESVKRLIFFTAILIVAISYSCVSASASNASGGGRVVEPEPSKPVDSSLDRREVFLKSKDAYVQLIKSPIYPRGQFLELKVPSESSLVGDVRDRLLFECRKLKDDLLELQRDVYSWAEALEELSRPEVSAGAGAGYGVSAPRPASPYREIPLNLEIQLENLRRVISGVARFQSPGKTWDDRLRGFGFDASGITDRTPPAFVMSYEEPFYRLIHRELALPVVSDSVVFPGEEKSRNILVIKEDRSSSEDSLFDLREVDESSYQFFHRGVPVAFDSILFPGEREARNVLVAREFVPGEEAGLGFSFDVFPKREWLELDRIKDDLLDLIGGLVGRISDLKERERRLEDLRRERIIFEDGGIISEGDVIMTVPTGAVIEPESFSIKLASNTSAFSELPEFVSPLTRAYEMTPHHRDPASYRSNPYEGRCFNDWVDLAFPVSPAQGPVALFIQKDDPQDRELKKWLMIDPDSVEGGKANFKVKSFSFCFLGGVDIGRELPPSFDYCYDPFPAEYRAFKTIRPGLNYRVCCESNLCNPHKDDFVIINRGFGDSRPNEDIGEERLSCPKCRAVVSEFDSLKQLILFQAKGTIKYKKGRNPAQEKTFEAFDSRLVLFGDSKIEETYSTFIINVEKQLSNLNLKPSAAFLGVDHHGNLINNIFDLGADGAFKGFHVLVGKFFGGEGFTKESFDAHAGKALREKGFGCYCTEDEDDFLEKLPSCHVAWVISSFGIRIKNERFVGAVKSFYESGKGLMLWEDNDSKKDTHTVEVLRSLFSGMVVEGNDPGQKLMCAAANCSKPQTFRKMHPVLRGIQKLYEGVTISHPSPAIPPFPVKVLATSSSNHPNIMYVDEENGREGRHGRVIIDCGFTKLFESRWDSAGTARYVKNAACWLTGLPDPD
jgi:hypothetical protein